MNKRQVITLWIIALLLGVAVAAVKLSQNQDNRGATKRVQGETLLESFPAADATQITIQGATDAVTLDKKDGNWVVRERGGFPANTTFVNNLLRTLAELKVTTGIEAGPSFAPRFGMDENSKQPEEHGLSATFKDATGKELATLSLGKIIASEAGANPMMGGGSVGRYVRNHADESGFYAVSEMFPSVTADPMRWLADGFVSPEKVESISVTKPDSADIAWKITRDDEEAEFKLEGAKSDEVLDTTVTAPLKSVLSYARFEDVVPADQAADRTGEGKSRTATIVTFEGFTYVVKLTPAKPLENPADADPNEPAPAADNFLMTVAVTAELPKERKKQADEKPEDAKTKDEAFAKRHGTLSLKLEQEKALSGVTFEVAKTTVEPLLQGRKAIITKAKPAEPGAANGPGLQKFPGGIVAPTPSSIVTPPVQVTPPTPPTTPPVSVTTPPIEAVTPPIQVPPADAPSADDEE
jgi:hypothetical protein